MYGKNSCQAFRFLILLLFSSLTVLATITLNVIGDVTAGLSHEVQWTRDPKDTDTFFLFKFNLDAKGKDKINTTGITVASSGLLSGTSQMLFIKPNRFLIFATEDGSPISNQSLAISNTFKVDIPSSSTAGETNTSISLPTSFSVKNSGATSTSMVYFHSTTSPIIPSGPAGLQPPTQGQALGTRLPAGTIAGAIFGSLAFLGAIGGTLHCWIRRHNRRQHKHSSASIIEAVPRPNEKLLPVSQLSSPSQLPWQNSTIFAIPSIPFQRLQQNIDILPGTLIDTGHRQTSRRSIQLAEVYHRVLDVSGSTEFQAMAAEVERIKLEIDQLKTRHSVDQLPPEYSSPSNTVW